MGWGWCDGVVPHAYWRPGKVAGVTTSQRQDGDRRLLANALKLNPCGLSHEPWEQQSTVAPTSNCYTGEFIQAGAAEPTSRDFPFKAPVAKLATSLYVEGTIPAEGPMQQQQYTAAHPGCFFNHHRTLSQKARPSSQGVMTVV
jgi:hypothetical protein